MPYQIVRRKIDSGGGREAGDIVAVKKAPCKWGREVKPPLYDIIEVTDDEYKNFLPYFKRHIPVKYEFVGGPDLIRPIEWKRVSHRIDFEKLEASTKALLNSGKSAKIQKVELMNSLVEKTKTTKIKAFR